MRSVCQIMMIVLLMASLAQAQQAGTVPNQPAPPAAPPNPAEQWLDYTLKNWEDAMAKVQSFHLELSRARIDATFKSAQTMKGTAIYQKAKTPKEGSRARLEMVLEGKPDVWERYICTGNFLYQYEPATKTIRVHDLPPPTQGNVGDDNFLQFIFGMKAAQAKQRYHMTYKAVPPPQDKFYHYIEIQPKSQEDKAEFSQARLVLLRDSFMPRQLWYRQPNGDEFTWDFPKVKVGAEIPPNWFQPPEEKGWKMERVQKNIPVSNPRPAK